MPSASDAPFPFLGSSISDAARCFDEELFGSEIHEKTIYPARFGTFIKDLDASAFAQHPEQGIDPAGLIEPTRGSYDQEVASELAGRPVWLSVSLVGTGKRRHFQNREYGPGQTLRL